MSTISRRVVYSLIAVVLILLVGIAALLSVANHRHQRLEDTTIDLQRNLSKQEGQIKDLRQRLENCDTVQSIVPPTDTAWESTVAKDQTGIESSTIGSQPFLR